MTKRATRHQHRALRRHAIGTDWWYIALTYCERHTI